MSYENLCQAGLILKPWVKVALSCHCSHKRVREDIKSWEVERERVPVKQELLTPIIHYSTEQSNSFYAAAEPDMN